MNPAHKRHWVDCIRLPSLQQKEEEEEEVAPSSTENLLCQEFFLHLLMRTGKQPVVQSGIDKKLSILPHTVIMHGMMTVLWFQVWVSKHVLPVDVEAVVTRWNKIGWVNQKGVVEIE